MVKVLSFLFLLDFSGSMEQKLDQTHSKSAQLKAQISAMLEAAPPEQVGGVLIFGAQPSKGCADLQELRAVPKELLKRLNSQKVGAFGKTPLSLGLDRLSRRAIESDVKNIVAITDGGDSCGADPCQALNRIDELLIKQGKKLNLFLLAFDLKQDRKKLSCFKSMKTKNLQVKFIDSLSGPELTRELKTAQLNALNLHQMKEDVDASLNSTSTLSDEKENKTAKSTNLKRDNNDKSSEESAGSALGFLEIVGAPIEAEFLAKNTNGEERNWHGSFVVQLKPGQYTLKFIDKWGLEMAIGLAPAQYLKIPWGQILKNNKAPVEVANSYLETTWQASAETQAIHGSVPPMVTQAYIDNSSQVKVEVPFGDYELNVSGPDWLKGALPQKKVVVLRGQTESINLSDLYGNDIKWVENPHSDQFSVMEVREHQGGVRRYLLGIGQKQIPVLKSMEVEFLKAP